MRWRTVLRMGAVVLAVGLTGSYVWFRTAQARERRHSAAAEAAAVPTTHPATSAHLIPSSKSGMAALPGSKFSDLSRNLRYSSENPYPSSNAISAGFKLNNSVSAEFAVASDTKAGMIDLIPAEKPTTRPATAPTSK